MCVSVSCTAFCRVWELSCSRESWCILCVVTLNEEGVLFAYMCVCVYVCAHEPVGNPVNHYCVSSMCARVCVSCLPGGLSLPAVLLCESEVSPLELPSALIWS